MTKPMEKKRQTWLCNSGIGKVATVHCRGLNDYFKMLQWRVNIEQKVENSPKTDDFIQFISSL